MISDPNGHNDICLMHELISRLIQKISDIKQALWPELRNHGHTAQNSNPSKATIHDELIEIYPFDHFAHAIIQNRSPQRTASGLTPAGNRRAAS